MKFAQVNYFNRIFESGYILTHLVPPKHSFHTSTHAIIFTLSMPYFKKPPSIPNSCLLLKLDQPMKSLYQLELPSTPIISNPMLYKFYHILYEWFINQPKVMLNKYCVMSMIITNIKMVLLNHIAWFKSDIPTINIHIFMFIQDIHKYKLLVKMIVLALYLSLGAKCIILNEVYHW